MNLVAAAPEERVEFVRSVCRRVLSGRARPELAAVFLYGSVLTSRFRPDSDIDVAVLDRSDGLLTWSEEANLMDGLEREFLAAWRDTSVDGARTLGLRIRPPFSAFICVHLWFVLFRAREISTASPPRSPVGSRAVPES